MHFRKNIASFCAFGLIVLAFMLGCSPRPDNPTVFWQQTANQGALAARLHARDIAGTHYLVAPTGSMEPFLTGGDYIVVDIKVPFAALRVGQIVTYRAKWLPESALPVTHRLAAKSGEGWIMGGDANAHYERGDQNLTAENYLGKVVAVYTQRQKS